MNSSWIRDMSVLSSINSRNIYDKTNNNNHYEYKTSNKGSEINTTSTDCSGYPSHIHFGDTSYTLGFGHLFSGNLHSYQSFNPIRQCYEPCSFELSECYSTPFNNLSQQEPVINHKVNEAMESIRKTRKNIEKQHDYSTPSVPYEYNSMINNCKQNSISQAAAMLERAANAMSIAANTQKQFRL